MDEKDLAPIALFVYNRPKHTQETLLALQKNFLAEKTPLIVFADGPKNHLDLQKTKEVLEIVGNAKGFKSIKVIQRPKNYGLAKSIISGVTEVVNTYKKLIVFEDDLISSPYTLLYFNKALCKYESVPKVMHIGAYMYPLSKDIDLPETFFYRVSTSWGWATWERAWKHFEPNLDKLTLQFDEEMIFRFSMDGFGDYWKQIHQTKKGKNNSWAIRWYASIFLKNGLALNPTQSLIHNIGNDGTGIHCGVTEIYDVNVKSSSINYFPEEVQENFLVINAIKNFLKNHKGNLYQRIKRYIWQQWTKIKHKMSSMLF